MKILGYIALAAIAILSLIYMIGPHSTTQDESEESQSLLLEDENSKLRSCIEELQASRNNALDELENVYSLDVEYGDYIPYDAASAYPHEATRILENDPLDCPDLN